jgi:hypothetical protein
MGRTVEVSCTAPFVPGNSLGVIYDVSPDQAVKSRASGVASEVIGGQVSPTAYEHFVGHHRGPTDQLGRLGK